LRDGAKKREEWEEWSGERERVNRLKKSVEMQKGVGEVQGRGKFVSVCVWGDMKLTSDGHGRSCSRRQRAAQVYLPPFLLASAEDFQNVSGFSHAKDICV